ncbi:MAG: phenylalanine--tRNA ligase subunit beta [Puniceicoccales bacterium]|nr:phenylalanine--tRNA ligase subunit beta [Puniceicoccales bacterium]
MNVSLNWLRRWLPGLASAADEIAAALSSQGLEVESWRSVGVPRERLVAGEVLSAVAHPRAERLRLCRVAVGAGEPLSIVCGADNFSPGDRVPVALAGCILPDGTAIAPAVLRGEESQGMLCSGRELGISDDRRGLLLLDRSVEPGTPLHEIFPGGDVVFALELTANRGDCLSHRGVARELAARLDLPLRGEWDFPFRRVEEMETPPLLADLRLEPCCCERFLGWEIRGVRVGPSPDWLRRDLELAGMRSVNNLVDITNWAMLDRGQPLHAFDVRKIAGAELCIRPAREGEELFALNHRRYRLEPGMAVIADREKPLVLAGIMGSVDAEVDDATENVVLECAAFDGAAIQLTARKLSLGGEASQRFARGVDRDAMESSLARAVALVEEICGGKPAGAPREVGTGKKEPAREISLCGSFVREKFGTAVEDREIEETLRRLHFAVEGRGSGEWLVTVPSFRRGDVTAPIDLVEEVVRFHGLERLGRLDVISRASARANDRGYLFQCSAAELLISLGYGECQTYSTRGEGEVCRCVGEERTPPLALKNPLNGDQTHLRPSLLPGLLASLDENLRSGNAVPGLFEGGRTWHGEGNELHEAISIGWLCPGGECRRADWLPQPEPDFYAMKTVARRVGDRAEAPWREENFVPIAESGPWQVAQGAGLGDLVRWGCRLELGLLDLEWTASLAIPGPVFAGEWHFLPRFFQRRERKISFAPFSHFPLVVRDLAVVADHALSAEEVRRTVEKCIRRALAAPLFLADLWIFDRYAGGSVAADKKGLALRFTIGREDGTPAEQEVRGAFDRILAQLATVRGVALRAQG